MSNAMKTLVKHRAESNNSKDIKTMVDDAMKTEAQAEPVGVRNSIAELKAIVLNVKKWF